MQATRRLPIVGVMGSGSGLQLDRAREVGRWLATQRVHLLTGGGGGTMESVSRAFSEHADRQGLVLGVLPGSTRAGEAPSGYPNRWVELRIATHLPLSGRRGTDALSRNHINVLSSDVLIALPGSAGTASEVALALRYGRPIVAYLKDRSEIEGLDPKTRVLESFEEVQEFVQQELEVVREAL